MRKNKLKKISIISFFLLIISCIAFLVLYALKQNINLYFTPQEIKSNKAPLNKTIRVGGMVKQNSIERKNIDIKFVVTDYVDEINIIYSGVLPDLFKEGQGVVIVGNLINNNTVIANTVLAKHDEKYMPREVADSIKKGRPDI